MTTGSEPYPEVSGASRADMDDEPVVHRRLGPYRLLDRLGEGGMGVVHRALDPRDRQVAIKVLRPHIAHDPDARTRLAREVDTLARVRHPRVAAVLDADVDGESPYIVTEYVPGPPLDAVVTDEGALPAEELVSLGRGLSEALQVIHGAGIVHRDLKPGNVLIVDGEPVVIDFGIAHVGDDSRLTRTGLVMGTPGYLSPEVVEGAPVTTATDWWGWAATLAFAASGRPPFGRGPTSAVLDRVSRGQADLSGVDPLLQPLLAASLSPVPAERPHAEEVLAAIGLYAEGKPVTMALPQPDRTAAIPPGVTARRPVAYAGDQWGQGDPYAGDPYAGDPYAGDGWGAPPPYRREVDPRIGRPLRSGTLAAALALLVAVAAIWPLVAGALVVAWSLAARTADRSVTATVLRRHAAGPRRSDTAVAVVASPWHLVRAVLATLLALILPAFVAVAGTLAAAFLISSATGQEVQPEHSLPVATGMLLAGVMVWWGPGGTSVRRGSRSIVRGVVPAGAATQVVVALTLLAAAGLALWAWQRGAEISWWPSPDGRPPLLELLPRLPS